jgi:hypothetical protein
MVIISFLGGIMFSVLNEKHLEYLSSKDGAYYKTCLALATKLAETREIKVVDLYGVQLSYRGINDDIVVLYNTSRNYVKVYKYIDESYKVIEEGIKLNFELGVSTLSEELLKLDRVWEVKQLKE